MDFAARLDFNGRAPAITTRTGWRERDRDTASRERAPFVVMLGRWRVAALAARGPVEIRCLSGQLWITQAGETGDVVLQAGQSHAVMQAARDTLLSTVGAWNGAAVEIVPMGRAEGGVLHFLRRAMPYIQIEL